MATQVNNQPEGPSTLRTSDDRERRYWVNAGLGLVLIVVGVLFLFQQVMGINPWQWFWPFVIIIPGLLFFAGMVTGGKSASGFAIPGSIITMVGLILLVQNTFNLWQTWAYAWALIFPTAVGIGIWLHGWWGDHAEERRSGRRMMEIGVVIFLAFAAFFELLLNLSGIVSGQVVGMALATFLILAGGYLLIRHDEGARSA